MLGAMMSGRASAHMREARGEEDVGAAAALVFVCAAAVASVAAIVLELAGHGQPGGLSRLQYVLVAGTVIGSWMAVGMAFTFHYAYLWYSSGDAKPLRFPDDPLAPDYWDFLYFSFTISVAAQTSDVTVTTTDMRRLVTIHSVLGFLFNAAIIGFSINMLAGAVAR